MTMTQGVPPTDRPKESTIAKIRGLLAKAESTDNASEAETFFAKAAEMMDRHRIDPSVIRDRRKEFVKISYELNQHSHLRASLLLLGAVSRHYGCVVQIAHSGNSKYPDLTGEADDVEATLLMFRSLIIQRDHALLRAPMLPGTNRTKFNNSFSYGFAMRINTRLKAIRAAAEKVAQAERNSMALEVYDRRDKVMKYLGDPPSANHNKASLSHHGLVKGKDAADNADLGQRRFEDGPRALGR